MYQILERFNKIKDQKTYNKCDEIQVVYEPMGELFFSVNEDLRTGFKSYTIYEKTKMIIYIIRNKGTSEITDEIILKPIAHLYSNRYEHFTLMKRLEIINTKNLSYVVLDILLELANNKDEKVKEYLQKYHSYLLPKEE